MTTTTPTASTPPSIGTTGVTLRRTALTLFGLFVLELVTGPSGVGEHAARAVVADRLVALHDHYLAEGVCDLAMGAGLLVLAAAARRDRRVQGRITVAGALIGAVMGMTFGAMFLGVAHAGAQGYASAYDAVPLRQTAITLSALASAPLGLVLAGLALRVPRRRSGRISWLSNTALVVATADVLSVVPLPGAGLLELGFLATIPILGLVAWRLPVSR